MDPQLPPRQSAENTYLSHRTLEYLFRRHMTDAQSDWDVVRYWSQVALLMFDDGTDKENEYMLGVGTEKSYAANILLRFGPRVDEMTVFKMECRAPGTEYRTESWHQATEDLIKTLYRTNSYGRRQWGAVAIGLWVKFYELIDGELTPLHDRPLSLDRQPQSIQAHLNDIKEHGRLIDPSMRVRRSRRRYNNVA